MPFPALPTTFQSGACGYTGVGYYGYGAATIAGFTAHDVICDDATVDNGMASGPYTYDYSVIGGPGWATTVAFEGGETITNSSGTTLNGVANNGTLALTETQAYETAAVLDVALAAMGTNPPADSVIDYQYALWYLFDNAGANAIVLDNQQLTDLFDAAGIVTSGSQSDMNTTRADAEKLVIFTPVPVDSDPEFLGLETPAGAPEPGTWVFIAGIGLLFLIPGIRSKILAAISRG